MKFEDWDLMDSEKLPHLAAEKLIKQKWLRGVEKATSLHLRWIPHYHHVPITIFVIKQLLCLVHDGYLWLEEPIPITADLIHRISRLLWFHLYSSVLGLIPHFGFRLWPYRPVEPLVQASPSQFISPGKPCSRLRIAF